MNSYITKEVDYAIRICAYLAGYYQQGPIPVSKISQRLYITKPFATKIIYQLRLAHIVASIQGKNGGIYLAQNPAELSMQAVLQAMEFNTALNECLQIEDVCPLSGMCKIHHFFAKQQNSLTQSFRQQMIADFAFTDDAIPTIHQSNG